MRVKSTGVDFRQDGVRYYRFVEVNQTFIGLLKDWLFGRPDYARMINLHIDGVRDGIAPEVYCCTRGFTSELSCSVWVG